MVILDPESLEIHGSCGVQNKKWIMDVETLDPVKDDVCLHTAFVILGFCVGGDSGCSASWIFMGKIPDSASALQPNLKGFGNSETQSWILDAA